MDEFAREEQEEQERQEERKHRRLRMLEEAIRFDEFAFNGEAAAEKLRLMAAVEGVSGSDALSKWLFDKADEFYNRGDQKGENAPLIVAVSTYSAALGGADPRERAAGLGDDPEQSGQRAPELGRAGGGTARLLQAVDAFRSALEVRTRESTPLHWATVQNNLGIAFARLGEREAAPPAWKQAVEAFRSALKVRTRESVPFYWAMTQNNLGIALARLGERESGHRPPGSRRSRPSTPP